MSPDDQSSLSTTKASKIDSNQKCQEGDFVTDLSRNGISNEKDEFIHIKQKGQTLDCTVLIDPSTISQASTTATNPIEAYKDPASQHHPHVQQQPHHVIHYPAEFMQLGKRKFQNFDSSQSNDEAQAPFQDFKFSNMTASHHNHSSLDNEAGLSLLFAASLLQQQEQSNPVNSDDTDNAHASGTITPLAHTDKGLNNRQQYQLEHVDGTSHPYHETSHSKEDEKNASLVSTDEGRIMYENMEDINAIEPRPIDVLCGRGGGINKHSGNIIYRRVVEFNKRLYKQVPKRHRMLVSRSIVQAIINAGGRFLQEQEVKLDVASSSTTGNRGDMDDLKATTGKQYRWTPIQIRRAVQKTSQALRERSCSFANGNDDNNDDDDEGHGDL